MGSYKYVKYQASLQDLVENARSEAEDVKTELEEWRDGMEGTNLETTEKYSNLSEAIDCIENGISYAEDVEDLSEIEGVIDYHLAQNKNKRRGCSRQMRMENAASMLNAVMERLRELEDAEDEDDDFDYGMAAEGCESASSEFESVEVPGMFG